MKNIFLRLSIAHNVLLQGTNLNEAFSSCVAILGESLKADRCYIYNDSKTNKQKPNYWHNTKQAKNIESALYPNYISELCPKTYELLRNNESISGSIVDLQESSFRQLMTEREVKSLVMVPIFSEDKFWGFICFEYCDFETKWENEIIQSVQLFAKNIGTKIHQTIYHTKIGAVLENFDYHMAGSHQGIWEMDLTTNIVIYSYNWAGIIGYQLNEIEHTYEFWRKNVHPEDITDTEKKLQKYISGEKDEFSSKFRMKHKKGYYIWIQSSALIKRDSTGHPIKIIGTHIDVNELEEQKIALQQSEQKLNFILENSSDVISQHDLKGNLIYVSKNCHQISNYTPEELKKLQLFEIIHPSDLQTVIKKHTAFLNHSNTENLIFRFKKKDSTYIWLETISKKLIEKNKIIGIQTSSRDISKRIEIEKKNLSALRKERELNEMKTNFIAMASHQFRTPLTVIYSNAELIEYKTQNIEKNLSENLKSISNRIKNEIDRMTELMNNTLIFGKYNSDKKLKHKIEAINFNEFIESLVTNYFSNQADGRKMEIQNYNQQKTLFSDRTLLIHIFTNIISNAFKYSNGKQNPTLKTTYLESTLEIEITDYGIGIPNKDINKLFNSFYRASNTSTIVGSGLGLTIVKQFTELLKGTIKLKSQENSGTTIKIIFPYEQK